MDWSATQHLNTLMSHHDGWEDVLSTYERLGIALFVLALAVLFALAGPRLRRAAVSAGAATGLALVVAQVLAHLVDRPRPFVAHPGAVHLFAHHVADAGFPSDHATGAFAISVAVWLHDRRAGWVLLALATVLSAGRVALGVHYPSDVLAGALLGGGAALLVSAPPVRRRLDALADAIGALASRRPAFGPN